MKGGNSKDYEFKAGLINEIKQRWSIASKKNCTRNWLLGYITLIIKYAFIF